MLDKLAVLRPDIELLPLQHQRYDVVFTVEHRVGLHYRRVT